MGLMNAPWYPWMLQDPSTLTRLAEALKAPEEGLPDLAASARTLHPEAGQRDISPEEAATQILPPNLSRRGGAGEDPILALARQEAARAQQLLARQQAETGPDAGLSALLPFLAKASGARKISGFEFFGGLE